MEERCSTASKASANWRVWGSKGRAPAKTASPIRTGSPGVHPSVAHPHASAHLVPSPVLPHDSCPEILDDVSTYAVPLRGGGRQVLRQVGFRLEKSHSTPCLLYTSPSPRD